MRVYVLSHKAVQEKLTMLRDRRTDATVFRKVLEELGELIGYHILDNLPSIKIYVETPLNIEAEGISIPAKDDVVLIGVMRTAFPLLQGLLNIFPNARTGFVSATRVGSKEIKNYNFKVDISYFKIPSIDEEDIIILADAMIATGSTLSKIIHLLLDKYSLKKLIITAIIATPIGLKKIEDELVNADVYVAAIDEKLDEEGHIVPGLGDAGDRAFGNS